MWLFRGLVPLGAVSWWMSMRYLPPSPPSGHKFDPLSALVNAIALGSFIPGLNIGRSVQRQILLEQRQRRYRRLPSFSSSGNSASRADAAGRFLRWLRVFALSIAQRNTAAAMITLIALPFYFQYVEGMSPIEIGMLITPWPAVESLSHRPAIRRMVLTGLLGGLGLAVMTGGLPTADRCSCPEHASRLNIAWRMAVCAQPAFQSPSSAA